MTFQRVPPDGYVKSMRMGNADVLNDGLHISGPPDTMLEVIIGGNAGRIEGSVVNTRNEPLANRTVVLVPDVPLRRKSTAVVMCGNRQFTRCEAPIRLELPEGFQTSEFLLQHGFIDRIIPRKDLRTEVARIIDFCEH